MSAPRFVSIDGKPGLVRDTRSFGLINTDRHSLAQAKRQKEEAMRRITEARIREREISELQSQVNTMGSDIAEIKAMLAALLSKSDQR